MEVAIIGAGLAGLSAARTLVEHDVDVEIFEATHRLGGRARTTYMPDATLPIELGPEFVHGDPDVTRELVRDPAIQIEEVAERHHMWRDGQLVELDDMWQRFGALLERAPKYAGEDVSAREYLARTGLAGDDATLLAQMIEGFYGAELDDISIAGVAADGGGTGGDGSPAQYHVRGGYGSIITSLVRDMRGATLHLGHVVQGIDWRERPVRIIYQCGAELSAAIAERVIVTLPVGVLHANTVRFEPALDREHLAALDKLAMGQVVKLVLQLREPVWQRHDRKRLDFVHARDRGFPTFWLRSHDRTHLLTAWAGGAHARALSKDAVDTLVERALDDFAAATGVARSRLAAAVISHHAHDYANDPHAHGAYSYTRVGAGTAVGRLARPLGARLFFAGEATDPEYEGTVAGALASGKRAADEVLRGLASPRKHVRAS